MEVADLGERHVGVVSEVRATAFQVERPDGTSLWLPYDLLFRSGNGQAVLICHGTHVDRYAIDPGEAPFDRRQA
jgi:hypothetical protein